MFVVSQSTLSALGWPVLLDALAGETRTPMGRERALALAFHDNPDSARLHLSRVGEARALAHQALELPLADVPDVRMHLERASREGVLDSFALRHCARLMRGSSRVRRFLNEHRLLAPQMAEEAQTLTDFDPLAAEIERAIEPSGTISDHASADLLELRERCRGLHRALKSRIDDMLGDEMLADVLRDTYFTIRDERYVLPVVAQHKARLPGIVHNASQTGQTLFVEPEQLIDLGNHLTIAQAMATEEEERILRDLTDAVGRRAAELLEDLDTLGALDELGACARIAERIGASQPELTRSNERLALFRLRHPLLALRGVRVVPNDIVVDEGRRGLVVSGPNSGGKTVSITAVGLCALMARAGLPITAGEGSSVPMYRSVHTAMGDESDLSKDLSTFTAHLSALRDIAWATVPGTLVCIDEIAADTDPREGAAIAVAVLEDLVERGATVFLTTHLDEVKAKGLTDPRLVSASMEFDFERLAPTYLLRMNSAGASSAVEVARRVGLDAKVCDRARELLGGTGGELGRAVQQLDFERNEVSRLRLVLDTERQALVRAREQWEGQRQALEQKEKSLEAGLRREVMTDIESARNEVRQTLARLQQTPSVKAAGEARQALERAEEQQRQALLRAQAVAAAAAEREHVEVETWRPGMRVQVTSMGREGEIMEVCDGQALVAVGPLKIRAPLTDLVGLKGAPKQTARLRLTDEEKRKRSSDARPSVVTTSSSTVDLRGMRADDALRQLRSAFDRMFQDGNGQAFVVHGHGTGALKKTVREELESSSYVQSFRPGEAHEGGDGVTVVTFTSG